MSNKPSLDKIFPACFALMRNELQRKISFLPNINEAEDFSDQIQSLVEDHKDLRFLSDLARLELTMFKVGECDLPQDREKEIAVNPCLELIDLGWKNLCLLISRDHKKSTVKPVEEQERVIVWPDKTGKVLSRPVTNNDLLALKLIVENIPVDEAAKKNRTTAAHIWPVINQAVQNNILVRNKSLISRGHSIFKSDPRLISKYSTADVFTLQWHITQACDLKCRHCYGRESREFLDLDKALKVLEDFNGFCRSKNVHGQVSLTGGNPMLHPHLDKIHEASVNYGFTVGILGNPAPQVQLESLLKKGPISFFQVSLEGLEEHNDFIRGKGHFKRVMDFLEILKKMGIYSMVMLTLTKANTQQVIPLAGLLQDKADLFTFNRLSMVGDGAHLTPADREEFKELLFNYQDMAKELPVMGFKDNFFNLARHQNNQPLFGGCTGYGCGAAFNFVSVLCDGDVHACRKFPSRLGNLFDHSLEQIYDSEIARKYRKGPESCKGCSIRPVCGGCLAVIYSNNLDVFSDRDPYCFIDEQAEDTLTP
jgi:selenobiotic family peptide radical SAM maturase